MQSLSGKYRHCSLHQKSLNRAKRNSDTWSQAATASKSPSDVSLLFGFQEEEASIIQSNAEAIFHFPAVVHCVSFQESSKLTVNQLIKKARRISKEAPSSESRHSQPRGTKTPPYTKELGRVILLCGASIQSKAGDVNSALVEKVQLAPCVIGAGGLPFQEGSTAQEVVNRLRAQHAELYNLILPWKTDKQYLTPPPIITNSTSEDDEEEEGGGEDEGEQKAGARLMKAKLVMNASLDSGWVPWSSDPLGIKGEMRKDAGHVVVLDGLCTQEERAEILAFLTSPTHDHCGSPPTDKWEKSCFDRVGDRETWGLNQEMLRKLQEDPPEGLIALQSRIQALYPEFACCHMPADVLSEVDEDDGDEPNVGCSSFVGNAVMSGDPCNWHVDADPSCFPPSSPWVHNYGYYFNREPGRPLFVSILLYLNDSWPDEYQSETMIMDRRLQVGLFVRPQPGRVFLMDQDLNHRISAPSALANGRPRYSLVWKSVFFPFKNNTIQLSQDEMEQPVLKQGRDQGAKASRKGKDATIPSSISRPEWGETMLMN